MVKQKSGTSFDRDIRRRTGITLRSRLVYGFIKCREETHT